MSFYTRGGSRVSVRYSTSGRIIVSSICVQQKEEKKDLKKYNLTLSTYFFFSHKK